MTMIMVLVVGASSYLQLALPAVNVVCRLVQLLQFSLFTENMAAQREGERGEKCG